MVKQIAAIAGQPNVGKSTAVRYLGSERGFSVVSPPEILKSYADTHGIELHCRSDWANVRQILSEEQGGEWLIDAIFHRDAEKIAIDGLSTVGDYEALEKRQRMGLARVAFVGLECAPEEQFKREVERAAPGKEIARSVEEMIENQKAESYSPAKFGIARQAVMNLIPIEMRISTQDLTPDQMNKRMCDLLIRQGISV